jgi:hypothetical protein
MLQCLLQLRCHKLLSDHSSKRIITAAAAAVVHAQGLGLQLKPDIAAPGFRLYSSTPSNNLQTLSGTSM